MSRTLGRGLLLLLTLGLVVAGAEGQSGARRAADPVRTAIRQAQTLARQGRAPEAVRLLTTLQADHPGESRIRMALAGVCEASGDFLQAAALYRAETTQRGKTDLNLWIYLARVYQRAGDGQAAVQALLEGTRQQPRWARQLGDLFETLAADESVGVESLAALEEAVAGETAPIAWRELLARIYATRGEGVRALELLVREERDRPTGGRILFDLGRTLAARGDPHVAQAAFDSVLALAPQGGHAEEAWFRKGELLAGAGRPAEAVDAYAQLEERFPEGDLAHRAGLARADLLLETQSDLEAARLAYAGVVARIEALPRSRRLLPVRDAARFGLGECALRAGRLERAAHRWEELTTHAAQAELRERAAFELAELLFYRAHFGEAEEAYYAFTDRYPSSAWTNDALERVLLLGENTHAGGALLVAYAEAAYQRRIGRPEAARARCAAALRDSSGAPVAADLMRELIELLGTEGDWAAADSVLERLGREHGDHRAAPAALLWLAERLAREPGGTAQAAAYYERLVLEYPRSFEAGQARRRLEEARRSARDTS